MFGVLFVLPAVKSWRSTGFVPRVVDLNFSCPDGATSTDPFACVGWLRVLSKQLTGHQSSPSLFEV